jgi:selenophosphate synthetase-related protein
VYREISDGLVDSRTDYEHTGWLGEIAKMLENRLFDGTALERLPRPAQS